MTQAVGVEAYMNDRVAQYREWYNRRAAHCKRWFISLRVLLIALWASVPILINFGGNEGRLFGTAAALMGLAISAAEPLLRMREQWENYRYTEQYLEREKYLYGSGAGLYQGIESGRAFRLFVERVEWAIAAENSTTLSTMALSPDNRIGGSARL